MSKTRNVNRAATFEAIMRRSKEKIADQLAGILMLLYNEMGKADDAYTRGWDDARKSIRNLYECDAWVILEDEP